MLDKKTLFWFWSSPLQPRQSIIVLCWSRRYIADARNAYNYTRSALWGLGGGLARLQSCRWFLMAVMPQSWCGLQRGQETIRTAQKAALCVTEVGRERWPLHTYSMPQRFSNDNDSILLRSLSGQYNFCIFSFYLPLYLGHCFYQWRWLNIKNTRELKNF